MIDGRMALGTWQGLYLFEHRSRPIAERGAAATGLETTAPFSCASARSRGLPDRQTGCRCRKELFGAIAAAAMAIGAAPRGLARARAPRHTPARWLRLDLFHFFRLRAGHCEYRRRRAPAATSIFAAVRSTFGRFSARETGGDHRDLHFVHHFFVEHHAEVHLHIVIAGGLRIRVQASLTSSVRAGWTR